MKRERNVCVCKPLVASALFLCASIAHAQATNVGALLDQGARMLSTDEIKSALIGATVSFDLGSMRDVQYIYKADGSISGRWQSAGDNVSSGAFGTWKIDGDKFCVSVQFNASYLQPFSRCPQVIFKVGEKYFFSQSSSDRSAGVREGKISR